MAGIKLGDRLLVVGCSDAILLAQLAVKTGLTGRAFAVDEREAIVTAAGEIATREGALVETATAQWTSLPVETDSFDVAVVRDVLPHLRRVVAEPRDPRRLVSRLRRLHVGAQRRLGVDEHRPSGRHADHHVGPQGGPVDCDRDLLVEVTMLGQASQLDYSA